MSLLPNVLLWFLAGIFGFPGGPSSNDDSTSGLNAKAIIG